MPAPTPVPLDPAIRSAVLAQARELVEVRRICQLLTTSLDGYPIQRGMGYILDGWRLYVSTIDGLAKAEELRQEPRCAMVWNDQQIRADHFVQLQCIAREVTGDELAAWQERRFERYPQERKLYGDTLDEWVGWVLEPVRLRCLGYVKERSYWGEVPIVYGRASLGLPPLQQAPQPLGMSEYSYQVADPVREMALWDAVGLRRVLPKPGSDAPARFTVLDAGNTRIQLHHRPDKVRQAPATPEDAEGRCSLLVADLDAALGAVTAHGGQVMGEVITLGGEGNQPPHRYAFVCTPAGEVFCLVEGDEVAYRRRLGMPPLRLSWAPPA